MSHLHRNQPHEIFLEQNGQASIEILGLIPIFLIFILAGLEFTNVFIQAQRVASICRDVTATAYRDCIGLTDTSLTSCVSQAINGTLTPTPSFGANYYAGIVLEDFDSSNKALQRGRIIVKVFTYVPDNGGTLKLACRQATVPETIDSDYPFLWNNKSPKDVFRSHYPIGDVVGVPAMDAAFTSGLRRLVRDDLGNAAYQNSILTGEVFFKYKKATILGYFLGPVLPDYFYETVVY